MINLSGEKVVIQYLKRYIYQILFALICIFWIILQLVYPNSIIYTGSDTGTLYLHAEYLMENKTPFSPEYYQATELKLLYSSIFFVPFMYIFSDFVVVKIFANLLLIVLFLLSYIYMLKQFKLDAKYGFLAMFIFLLPLSNHWIYIGILGSFYLLYYIETIFIIALIYSISYAKNKSILLFFIYTLITIGGGITSSRILQIIYIPLQFSTIFLYIIYKFRKYNVYYIKKYCIITLYGLIVALLSYFIIGNKIRSIINYKKYSIGELNFQIDKNDINRLIENTEGIFSIYKFDDTISILSNISVILVVIIFVYMIFKIIFTIKNEKLTLLITYFITAIFIQIVLLLLYNGYRPRYCFPSLIVFPVIVCIYVYYFYNIRAKIISALFICLLFFHGIIVVYYTYDSDKWSEQSFWLYKPNLFKKERDDILSYVLSQNYENGYTSFHDSLVLYVLSNGKLSVGSLVFNTKNCTIVPRRVESLRKYYIKEEIDVPAFFVVPKSFYNKCKDINKLLMEKEHTYENDMYIVYEGTKNNFLEYLK